MFSVDCLLQRNTSTHNHTLRFFRLIDCLPFYMNEMSVIFFFFRHLVCDNEFDSVNENTNFIRTDSVILVNLQSGFWMDPDYVISTRSYCRSIV